jgi:hypothetical protein
MKQKQQGVKENQASTTAAMLHEKEILYGKQWQVAGISKSPESARLKTEKIAFGESCSDVPVLGQVDEIRICRGFLCVANQPGFLFACARNYSALASEKRKRSSTRIKSAGKSHPINLDQKSVQATLIQIIAAKSVCITRDIRSAEKKKSARNTRGSIPEEVKHRSLPGENQKVISRASSIASRQRWKGLFIDGKIIHQDARLCTYVYVT